MKVIDLTTDVAGRFAAKLLAMTGADVIRPARGEGDARLLALYLDDGKRVGVIDGRDDLAALVQDAALIFCTWDHGAMAGAASRLPPVPQACCKVVTSTFGTTGPYAGFRGGPMAEWAAGGYLGITGDPDREPLIGPENLCAYVCGYAAALAAEAALRQAQRTGAGVTVDISTMETMLSLHQSTFSRLAAGWVRTRTGRFAEVYPLTVRPCQDGHISLGVVTDEEFDRLTIAFGLPDLAADPRFANRQARMRHVAELDAALDRYLGTHTAAEAVAALQGYAVAAAKVVRPDEVLDNIQLGARGYWARAAEATMPGNPVSAPVRFAECVDVKRKPDWPLPARRPQSLPLSGITVLDFTAYWAGPSATRFLADLGAEVIWLERPGSREDFDPVPDDPQAVQLFLYHQKMNRHKRSVVVDLDTPVGREAARRLAQTADVVVENYRPGVAARCGLDPVELCGRDPRLVYVSLSGYGSGGPWGDWRSFGPNLEAASSMLARTGYSAGEPMRLGHALPDGVGGLAGALAVLRGLRERDETGRGGWFDLSQLEVYTAICGEDIAAASTGTEFPRIGNRSRTAEVVQGVFPCKGEDQWIALRLSCEADREKFAGISGLDPLGPLESWEPAIGRFTCEHNKRELAKMLQEAGIEAFPVYLADEFARDPHLAERGFFVTVDCHGRSHVLPGAPFRSGPAIANLQGRAPRFGEHSHEVAAAFRAARRSSLL
jgi:crotonobetainyl-CoA:carnitine CoA-transferase CaiB-like acyl-CoA transferase